MPIFCHFRSFCIAKIAPNNSYLSKIFRGAPPLDPAGGCAPRPPRNGLASLAHQDTQKCSLRSQNFAKNGLCGNLKLIGYGHIITCEMTTPKIQGCGYETKFEIHCQKIDRHHIYRCCERIF